MRIAPSDCVLVMTVNPGFAGHTFIPYVFTKMKRFRELIDGASVSVAMARKLAKGAE